MRSADDSHARVLRFIGSAFSRRLHEDFNGKCQDEKVLNSKLYELERKNVVLATENKEVGRDVPLLRSHISSIEGSTEIRTRVREPSNVRASPRRIATFARQRTAHENSNGYFQPGMDGQADQSRTTGNPSYFRRLGPITHRPLSLSSSSTKRTKSSRRNRTRTFD